MPTSTFDWDNAGISYYGRVGSFSGTHLVMSAWQSSFVTVFTGTAASVRIQVTTDGYFSYSVDNAAFVTPVLTINVEQNVSVASGLSDGPHLLVCKCTNQFGVVYPFKSQLVSVTGAAPAIRAAGAAENYGPYRRLGDAVFLNSGDRGSMLPYDFTGAGYSNPPIYNTGDATRAWYDSRFRFRAKASRIALHGFVNGAKVEWDIDGVRQGVVTLTYTGVFGFVTLATGLDNSAEHLYGITYVNGGTDLPGLWCDAVMISGVGAAFSNVPVPVLPRIAGFGDSIVSGEVTGDSSLSWIFKLSASMGRTPVNKGIGGNQIAQLAARTADITSASPAPDICLVLGGTNDVSQATPTSAFGTNFRSMLTNLLTGSSSIIYYVMALLPRGPVASYTEATMAAWNGSGDGIQGCIATVKAARPADAARLNYIDTAAWNMSGVPYGSNYSTYFLDELHPNAAGGTFISQKLFSIISPAEPVPDSGITQFGNSSYGLLFNIASNTASGPEGLPQFGDSRYTLLYKVASNIADEPPRFGDSLYTLLSKIAGSPKFGHFSHTLLSKIAADTGGSPGWGDSRNTLLQKIASNTASAPPAP